MKNLQELLTLRESMHHPNGDFVVLINDYVVTVGAADDPYQQEASVDLLVRYDYEGEDYADHPYGESSAREYFSPQIHLYSAKVLHDVDRYNEDGEQDGILLIKNTDLMDQSWWNDKMTEDLADVVFEAHQKEADDVDDFIDDDGYGF